MFTDTAYRSRRSIRNQPGIFTRVRIYPTHVHARTLIRSTKETRVRKSIMQERYLHYKRHKCNETLLSEFNWFYKYERYCSWFIEYGLIFFFVNTDNTDKIISLHSFSFPPIVSDNFYSRSIDSKASRKTCTLPCIRHESYLRFEVNFSLNKKSFKAWKVQSFIVTVEICHNLVECHFFLSFFIKFPFLTIFWRIFWNFQIISFSALGIFIYLFF